MSTDTYKIETYCTNCNFTGPIDIEKGKFVADKECPSCGNKSLEKKEPPLRMTPHVEDYR